MKFSVEKNIFANFSVNALFQPHIPSKGKMFQFKKTAFVHIKVNYILISRADSENLDKPLIKAAK